MELFHPNAGPAAPLAGTAHSAYLSLLPLIAAFYRDYMQGPQLPLALNNPGVQQLLPLATKVGTSLLSELATNYAKDLYKSFNQPSNFTSGSTNSTSFSEPVALPSPTQSIVHQPTGTPFPPYSSLGPSPVNIRINNRPYTSSSSRVAQYSHRRSASRRYSYRSSRYRPVTKTLRQYGRFFKNRFKTRYNINRFNKRY